MLRASFIDSSFARENLEDLSRPHASTRDLQRFKRLLTRATRDPSTILEDRRCHKAEFFLAFIDVCNQRALQGGTDALAHAEAAIALAEKIDGPHFLNLARGVKVHALIDRNETETAEKLLRKYQPEAAGCCDKCLGDWLWRLGDLMSETRRPAAALLTILQALSTHHEEIEPDILARLYFVYGIACHLLKIDRLALEAAGMTLLLLDLDSPRGYFEDSLAFIALYLSRSESLNEPALKCLQLFNERIAGLKGWQTTRVRLSWVEGLIFGRLGDLRRATDRLDRVRKALLKSGPSHHAVAVTLDLCQIYARSPRDPNLRAITREISNCLRRKPSKKVRGGGWGGLEPGLQKTLEQILALLSLGADHTLPVLVDARNSFIAVVPGILGSSLLETWLTEKVQIEFFDDHDDFESNGAVEDNAAEEKATQKGESPCDAK